MNKKLIDILTQDLTPTQPLYSPLRRSFSFGIFLILFFAPLIGFISGYRESLSQELLHPKVLLEIFLIITSFSFLLLASFKSVIPGEDLKVYIFSGFFFLFSYFLVLLFFYINPYEHSFIHAHNHQCATHLYLFSAIAQCTLLYFLNKGVAMFSYKTSLLSSLSVSLLSLMLMNFTCMFDYNHILKHHFISFLIISLILTLLSSIFFKIQIRCEGEKL